MGGYVPVLLLRMTAGGFLAGGAVLAGMLLLWRLNGQTVVSVESNSMQPTFQKGDALLVAHAPAASLQPGQIVSYRNRAHAAMVISHRLVRKDSAANTYVLQADASAAYDEPVQGSQVIGQALRVLPQFGTVLQWLRAPLGLILSMYIPACLLLYFELQRAYSALTTTRYRVTASGQR